jgi:DNA-binding beta-propeller fold protein YncE
MAQRLSRRQFVRALGAGVALAAGVAPIAGVAAPAGRPPVGPALRSERSEPAEAASNVWHALTGPLPERLAGLPPRVYVPNELGGDIAVIDPTIMQVVDRFWVGRTPHHVTPSYEMDRLYVSVMDSNLLVAIDPWTGRPAGTVPAAVPYNLYFTPDGTKAVVAAERANRLDFYDPHSWQPLARVPIPGSGVDHLDFSADGSFLMVSCEFGGQLVKVNCHYMAVEGVVRVGGLPIDVKLSAAGDVFYVANQGRHGVSIVDPFAMREVDFLGTGRGAHGMAISRDARALYVTNRLAGTISVIDFEAGGIAGAWWVGGSPDMVQVAPDGSLWTSNRAHGTISVVDTGSGQVIHRVWTGAGPHGLTFFPQPGRFSVGHNGVYR